MALAHAALQQDALEDLAHASDDDSSVDTATNLGNQTVKDKIDRSKEVNLSDENAFPSLGTGSSTRPASLWGKMKPSLKPVTVSSSQVVTASDLVTETLKLEAAQQQARSLGRNQTSDVVRDVQKSTGTTVQMSTAQKTGTTVFIIRGKPDAVVLARRTLLKELGKKVVLKLLVPSLVRPYIIGSKGRTLKTIIDKTGAKVQLPKRDETSKVEQEIDPEELVEITIEGDFDGANQARKEIEAIVAERTSSTSIKITSIPSDFYGLLTLRKAEIKAGRDVKIKIPSASFTEDVPVAISVSGEKSLVAEVKVQLESLYEDLQRTTIPTSFPVAKKQHKFIAASIQDILTSTGCSVTVPPPSSTSDHITIRGPGANIGAGITLVMEKANSMAIDSLEISRAHQSSANQVHHAADISNFLRKTDQLQALEKNHSVSISIPSEAQLLSGTKVVYDITGKSASGVSEARAGIIALVNGLKPEKIQRLTIEPLLHKKITGPKSKNTINIRKQHEVEVVFPSPEVDNDQVVLVYSGTASTPEDISVAMQQAQNALKELLLTAGQIVSESIVVPSKHHSVIMGKNNTTLNAITGGSDATVRVVFGQPKEDSITVRGPSNDVTRVIKDIREVAAEAENSEVANSFKVEFEFPSQFTKNLIGKGGANISKIRDELGVRIDVGDEGKITCQGPQRNVEEAKSRITMLGDRLADETTFKLKIPAEFHGQIIGQGGKFVKRLEDKYQVQINFPKTTNESAAAEESSSKNEVTVKGGKKGATAAKAEIMELFEYENEHSHSVTIEVLQKAVSQIVGKSGSAINELKDETHTRIDIGQSVSSDDDADALVSIVITGKKSQVETAKKSILEVNSEVADTVTRTLIVDPAYHRTLIGPGGSNLRDLVVKAGGPDDASLRARMVRFPRTGVDSNEVVLKGSKKVVDKISKAIEKIIGDASSQHSEVTMVPKEQVRIIIGRGGNKKSELESKFSVTIDIPRADANGAADVPVKVLGSEDGIASAIAEIVKLVKVPESETVQVPRKLHRQVADGGSFIRKLKIDYKVSVDHDGHEIPKAATKAVQGGQNGIARIDDDDDEGEHSNAWSVTEVAGSGESGDIPWVLKGDAAQIAKAKKALSSAVSQAASQTHVGHLSVPAAKHRFIIGQGGSTINAIRTESGTKIDVPRNQGDEVIVIKGSKEGLEKAKALILEATTAPSGGGRREH
ncbi:KH domain-containing protein C550.14 [Taphrina deformans PYCC 5710]|uniref:KH domain-containing protein C550.14 n=1 Tax=Taphrina deformans (strain PYCC 5710 / ATCC 11124 / CBS 356.35 / IMI 108563 / JCM 9778 / NBRC 8474) TaxID=1097556 RepID=R4XHP9_TAPDE|nr:KH domain-containing protein C550.14 [Taphrina deformans PYCC 5710]|eukprot:CCG82942.1 KH domain-containing protein C550.14 [Taphrina deformans PYCC 5710]